MSQPNAPGGRDEVIRVVYEAVADFAQLMRQVAAARAEVKRLAADVRGIGGSQQVQVRVTTNAAQARTEVLGALRDLTVRVKLAVRATETRAEINRVLSGMSFKVTLKPDLTGVREQIRVALAAIKSTVTVGVKLDSTGVVTAMRAIIARLKAMGPVALKVVIDSSITDAVDALDKRLQRMRSDLSTSGGGGGPPNQRRESRGPEQRLPPPPRKDGKQPVTSFEDFSRGVKTATSMISLYGTAVAAAVPVTAALAAGAGAVAAAMLSAGAATGLFAVAAIGQIANVTKAVEAAEKTGAPAEGRLGDMVRLVQQVKAEYKQLLQETQQPVFDVFERGLALVLSLLPRLTPVITQVSEGIGAAVDQVGEAVNSPGFNQFLNYVGRTGPAAIGSFTQAIIGFVAGVVRLIMAFDPLVQAFLAGFARMGQAFADWSAHLDSDQGFQEFLSYAREQIPLVIELVGNLVAAALSLLSALAPIGHVVLVVANAFLALIAATPAPVLTSLLSAILALAVAVRVAAALNTLVKAVRAVAAVAAIQAMLVRFAAVMPVLAKALGVVTTSMGGATVATVGLRGALTALVATTVIGAALAGIVLLVSKLSSVNEGASEATLKHADAVRELGKALAESGGKFDENVRKQQLDALSQITGEGKAGGAFGFGGSTAKMGLLEAAKQAGISQADLVTGSTGEDPKKQAQNIGKLEDLRRLKLGQALYATGKAKDDLEAEAAAIAELQEAYESQSASVGEAAAAQKEYEAAIGGATEAAHTEAAAMAALAKAIGAANNETEQQKTLTTAVDALAAADEAAKQYQAALRGQSAAARQAVQAEEDLTTAQQRRTDAQAALNQAVADAKDRLIDLQRQLRDQPIDERQLKLNARRAAEAYQKALNSGGQSPDDLEQLRIDQERADNALGDFEQDKGKNRRRAQKELDRGVAGNQGVINANKALSSANKDVARAQQRVRDTARDARLELAELKAKADDSAIALQATAGAAGLTVKQLRQLKKRLDQIKSKSLDVVVNTDDAMAKLQAVLAMQLAPKILALHPEWSVAQVLAAAAAEARKATPPVTTTKPTVGPDHQFGGYAGGGAVAVAPSGGAVRGPGGPTGDRVPVRLPVGGDVRLSDSEHIWTALEVALAGGHRMVEWMRAGVRAGMAPAMLAGLQLAGTSGAGQPGVGFTGGFAPIALPVFASPVRPQAVPGYATGGPVAARLAPAAGRGRGGLQLRDVIVNNPIPEKAGTSVYRAVRKLSLEAEED